jgi:hypothetical protein
MQAGNESCENVGEHPRSCKQGGGGEEYEEDAGCIARDTVSRSMVTAMHFNDFWWVRDLRSAEAEGSSPV